MLVPGSGPRSLHVEAQSSCWVPSLLTPRPVTETGALSQTWSSLFCLVLPALLLWESVVLHPKTGITVGFLMSIQCSCGYQRSELLKSKLFNNWAISVAVVPVPLYLSENRTNWQYCILRGKRSPFHMFGSFLSCSVKILIVLTSLGCQEKRPTGEVSAQPRSWSWGSWFPSCLLSLVLSPELLVWSS